MEENGTQNNVISHQCPTLFGFFCERKGIPSVRWLFACMAFLGNSVVLMMRLNISVAMAIMAGSGSHSHHNSSSPPFQMTMNGTYSVSLYPAPPSDISNVNTSGSSASKEIAQAESEFNWSSHIQELLLAAFYIGYTLGNIPAGWLADRFGGKWIVFGGAFGSAVFNILGPLAARSSVELFFATRCLAGFVEGSYFPALYPMVNNWSPVKERTRMMALVVAGFAFGPALGQSISGVICANLGWPASFYFVGGVSILWAILWTVTAYDHPDKHPCIKHTELDYIERTRSKRSNTSKVPIRSILLSLPVIAYAITLFCIPGFVYFNLACNLPIYFKHVLQFDIMSVGFLTSIPYVCQWTASLLASFISDALINRNILSRTSVRKLIICSGATIMAACFLSISFIVKSDSSVIVIIVIVMYGAMGVVFSAVFVNAMDLAPSYSGTVSGISNAVAVSSGFIGPIVTSLFTEDQTDPAGWRIVFLITTAVTLFGPLVFLIIGSGDVQPWAIMADEDVNEMDKTRPDQLPDEDVAMIKSVNSNEA
ncbi:sialin-like isoform X1 [Lytechinus variegatus]|uniref:sialin-like isoform X1 n=1 Tax=Lytechinus variegatus TaxID=7654 RepID=UPI001BB1C2B8|nr:sialin-like isoform X1 [Lytechinus variegatus]